MRPAGFVGIILIILGIALPKFATARMNSQEMAAIAHVKTLHTAQTQYYSQFGKYATSLTDLGPPASGQPGPAGSDLIPGELATGKKGGYNFQMVGSPAGYTINANPEAYNTTGRRSFFSDQSMVIRENWGAEPANANSKEIR